MPTSNPPAVQLYSVREQLPGDRKGVLKRIAAAGYGAVEAVNVLSDTDGLRADLDEAGLTVCSVHAIPASEQAAEVLTAAKTLGASTVIVPYLPPARFATAESVADVARELNEMAARAADAGLRLGYHNHDFELSSIVGGRPALEVLTSSLDVGVLLEVDTYWAAVGGQDVPELLARLGDRVRFLHIKDGPITKDDPMTAVGAGRMPVAEILAAAPSAEWHIVELDRCATDMLSAVEQSLRWLAERGLATPAQGSA
jgi:sugar phosphate isomerase/epimerase